MSDLVDVAKRGRSLRAVYRGVKESTAETAGHTERASRAAADSAERVRDLIPTKRQALVGASGATAVVAGTAGTGAYMGTRGRKQESMQKVGVRKDWAELSKAGESDQQTKIINLAGSGLGFGLLARKAETANGRRRVLGYGAGAIVASGAVVVGHDRYKNRKRRTDSQLVHVTKADIMRYGNGSSVGRRMVDLEDVEKGIGSAVRGALKPKGKTAPNISRFDIHGDDVFGSSAGTHRAAGIRRADKLTPPRVGARPSAFGKAARNFDPEERRRHNQGRVAGASGAGALGVAGGAAYSIGRDSHTMATLPAVKGEMNDRHKKLMARLQNTKQVSGKTRSGKDIVRAVRGTPRVAVVSGRSGALLLGAGSLAAVSRHQTNRARSDRNRTWG